MSPADLFPDTTDTINLFAGEYLFREGETGEFLYVVLDGLIDIWVGNDVFETVARGGIVGEMALIDNVPRSATAIAKASSRLVAIDKDYFRTLVQQTPDFSLHIMKILAERLRRMDKLSVVANDYLEKLS